MADGIAHFSPVRCQHGGTAVSLVTLPFGIDQNRYPGIPRHSNNLLDIGQYALGVIGQHDDVVLRCQGTGAFHNTIDRPVVRVLFKIDTQ